MEIPISRDTERRDTAVELLCSTYKGYAQLVNGATQASGYSIARE